MTPVAAVGCLLQCRDSFVQSFNSSTPPVFVKSELWAVILVRLGCVMAGGLKGTLAKKRDRLCQKNEIKNRISHGHFSLGLRSSLFK